jgi:hypothetical protein
LIPYGGTTAVLWDAIRLYPFECKNFTFEKIVYFSSERLFYNLGFEIFAVLFMGE